MSYIVRTGNLASTPELRQGEHGPYTYARVIVSDRIRQEDGSYADGPAVAYDVAVSGNQATNLVDAAQMGGNIRVTFAGRYRVTEYRGEQGSRIQHEVNADEVAVSLRGQTVRVITPSTSETGD
ncbi:single-stranded DNA-binding protein (plasmid) [Xylanimonas allomyrinae]|uniref:Single-stranded DNA-binding protein n=1 Tax=Xylanimonas allomyrinae TaxID=2509459 RepID=A0A4P6ETM9_9MICO|nr:single-stranded DNA-binding protein [Xylanimonas allomyrinae]QAY64989.1 single-stranded DNA-binding protein [Xylanimonas allomyrinae]